LENKQINIKEDNNGLEEARKLVKESEEGLKDLSGPTRWLVPVTAAAWSLFQLALPSFLILNAVYIRAIHLAFAIVLVFLSYPMLSKPGKSTITAYLSARDRITVLDYATVILAAVAALYLAVNYNAISNRMGAPNAMDIVMGVILLIILLEAARRSLGIALPIVAIVFILYSFFGPYMPDLIAFKGVSVNRFIGQITMSTEGIYGIPLDVSATIVFLFVLFGAMLEKAGAGEYFVHLAFSILGRFKGGPAKAAVLASGLTGLVSGSSIANVVTTGTFTIPLMKRSGYPDYMAGSVEVACSTNGQIMPPIMGAAAFIIAEYCNMPYLEVVKAAFIPAVISYIALMYITHVEATKLGLQGMKKEEIPPFWSTFFKGIHYILPLIFLVVELVVFRHSPQLAAFYAILVLIGLIVIQNLVQGVRHGIGFGTAIKDALEIIWNALVAGGKSMMGIGVAVAAAGIIVGVVTMGLGGIITEVIDTIAQGNFMAILVLTAVASLILGMGLPTTATYIVLASLTANVIVTLGQNAGIVFPLIAAHLFVFFFGIIADDTPPVGLAAYAAAAIAGADPIKTGVKGFSYDIRTAILPFMFIYNTDLLLINIHSVWHAVWIFFTSCLAMFAFSNLTLNFFLVKNRLYEIGLLAAVTFVLLRPKYVASLIDLGSDWGPFLVGVAGIAVYALIYLMQRARRMPAEE
jgi:TRAP transporter 4TM/12TM fusion protein